MHPDNSDEEPDSHVYMENGILVEKKLVVKEESKDADGNSTGSKSPSKKKAAAQALARRQKWYAHNIAEYLFFNDNGQLEISEESIRQTYSAYTTILSNAHKSMRQHYEEIMKIAFGSNTDNIPLPLTMPVMVTFPLQHYLEQEMIDRLGF